ncbi:hypothetical protein BA70_06570 [Bacillus zhangzhouensis]|uniref:Uncharacterized protein n=1 Tax=Bacillus zhangzhouensis TaxID=1178540 RepID=A0A081L8Q8_9BACI|nr:hypothetical protein BA70_06570 [Bacillus zhangzhouensis]
MFSYKHSFSPLNGRGGTKENEPLEYTTKSTNRKVITGEERQQPVRAIKGKKSKIFDLRKNFYEIYPNINRKFSNFPVVISIKQAKRHKSKELI